MKTVKKRRVRRAKGSMNPYLCEATPEQRRWLQTHTISDLEDIAEILEYQGENVDGIRQVIKDLNTVAANLGIVVKRHAEHDLLEFVRAEETKAEA
ncbi:MAG: hypothetical protein JSV56_12845 [Methanomassiliicoccales archaeon]|nr:MAG: hypothetical protein JSV56_12845 [Methanomassiliicoccales archaeon]